MKPDLRAKMAYKPGDKVKITGPVKEPGESWGGVSWNPTLDGMIGHQYYISRKIDLHYSYDAYSLCIGNPKSRAATRDMLRPIMEPGKEKSNDPRHILMMVPHWMEPVQEVQPHPGDTVVPLTPLNPLLVPVKTAALLLVQSATQMTQALDKLSRDLGTPTPLPDINPAWVACLDIFQDYEEDEVKNMPPSIQSAWAAGKMIYEDQKNFEGKGAG